MWRVGPSIGIGGNSWVIAMSEPAITLHGEILVPYALMQARQAPEVERLLQGYGMLPAWAENRRWQIAAERSGYVLTFTVLVTTTD